MIVRVRSRDGLERVTIPDPAFAATVQTLKLAIEAQLRVPVASQALSLNRNLLLSKTPDQTLAFSDLANPAALLSSLNISHGSVVFLAYDGERTLARPAALTLAASFRRIMTIDDLIAKQMKVSRQETSKCKLASFDRDAANSFQLYVNQTLAFATKRGGFLYGKVTAGGAVEVDFIYEPPQQGTKDDLVLMRNSVEEARVEAIAAGLGMRRVGFVFSQAVGRKEGAYTLSGREVIQAAELQAEGGIDEWVTAVVKLDGETDVHFEAFQMSDICIRLFKEGWFVTEIGDGDDPKVSRMKKDVVIGVKDAKEVDNDYFLVPIKISDHQGPLSASFPVENRIAARTRRDLKDHLRKTERLPLVKRISDFHLLLLVANYLGVHADIPALAACVHGQTAVPDGFQLLIDSLASIS